MPVAETVGSKSVVQCNLIYASRNAVRCINEATFHMVLFCVILDWPVRRDARD